MFQRRHSLAVLLLLTLIALRAAPAWGQSEDDSWPNIQNPGMDLGDFPNSAYTLPQGAVQIEVAPFSIVGEDEYNPPEYFTQFLLRYGVTDNVEFRVLGNGFTWNYTEPQTTGFSPLSLDAKVHLWDSHREWFIPASSLEVVLTTDWGSRAFSSGYNPSINLNFDLPLTDSLNLAWAVGYGEVVSSVVSRTRRNHPATINDDVNQTSFQWAVEQNVTDALQVFITGQCVESVPGQTAGTSLAFGGSWCSSKRVAYYGLLGWGVTSDAPKIAAQIGVGFALGRLPSGS